MGDINVYAAESMAESRGEPERWFVITMKRFGMAVKARTVAMARERAMRAVGEALTVTEASAEEAAKLLMEGRV